MENEKHFPLTPEAKERPAQEYAVNFLAFNNPKARRAEKTYDTGALVEMLNDWWDGLCKDRGLNPGNKKLDTVGYCILELGKNALEHAYGGEIKVVVTDGKGWEGDPNDDLLYGSPGRGLSQVKRYADEFIIETRGKKYTKSSKRQKLVISEDEDTAVGQGSRVTFIKKFDARR
jgi:hypothetical protein